MKFSMLPLLATALPLLLVQHATSANAASLCIPGIYCPELSSVVPDCSTSGTASHSLTLSSSKATSTVHTEPSVIPSAPIPTWPVVPSAPIPTWPVIPSAPIPTWTTVRTSAPATTPHSSSTPGGSAYTGPATATTTITVTNAPAPTGSTCSTGPVQCCNSVESSSSENATKQLGLLGIVLSGANAPVGLTCTPITAIGVGSAGSCNAQTVCCQNNNFNGLINIGCTPINIGL